MLVIHDTAIHRIGYDFYAVGRLVETAVSIDVLNLRWERFQCSDSKYLSELAEQRAIAAFANHSPSERR